MGWGLILIAVNQPMHVQTAPTTSGASPGADQSSERNAQSNEDPMWELACLNASQLSADPLWERACPRRRCVSHCICYCTTAFAGKPAPTFDLRCFEYCVRLTDRHQGLPPMLLDQFAHALAGSQLSGSSPIPYSIFRVSRVRRFT